MSPLDQERERQLLQEMTALISRIDPQWTGANQSDPGITLVEVFAWLGDNLLYRAGTNSAETKARLRRLIAQLEQLATTGSNAADELKRVKYFDGQLLSAADLQAEQVYQIKKRRLHNRMLFGAGVVSGLQVTVDSSSTAKTPAVTVSPGFALDAHGNELSVESPLRCTLQANESSGYVILCYCEEPTDAVPLPSGAPRPTRVAEGVSLSFATSPVPDAGVALAHLLLTRGKWKLDPKFRVRKIKR